MLEVRLVNAMKEPDSDVTEEAWNNLYGKYDQVLGAQLRAAQVASPHGPPRSSTPSTRTARSSTSGEPARLWLLRERARLNVWAPATQVP